MLKEVFAEFLAGWPADKAAILAEMQLNKEFNLNLKTDSERRKAELYGTNAAVIISEVIPKYLYELGAIQNSKYKIEGSVGKGQPVEIPWIGVFDLDITSSAQTGYYIVYLFEANMLGFYISLNQGWTQYEKEFGPKLGLQKIKENANLAKTHLRGLQGFNFEAIKLHSGRTLGKGYDEGNICSKYYSYAWDNDYKISSNSSPEVAICKVWKSHLYLENPPVLKREDKIKIFGTVPATINPPSLNENEWVIFKTILSRLF